MPNLTAPIGLEDIELKFVMGNFIKLLKEIEKP